MEIRGLVAIGTLIIAVSKSDVFGINSESKLLPSFPASFDPSTIWSFKGVYSKAHGNLLIGWSGKNELSVCFFDTNKQKSTRLSGQVSDEPVIVGSLLMVAHAQPVGYQGLSVFNITDLSAVQLQAPIEITYRCVIKQVSSGPAMVFTDDKHGVNVYEFDREGNQTERVLRLEGAKLDRKFVLAADNDTVLMTANTPELEWWSLSKGKLSTASLAHLKDGNVMVCVCMCLSVLAFVPNISTYKCAVYLPATQFVSHQKLWRDSMLLGLFSDAFHCTTMKLFRHLSSFFRLYEFRCQQSGTWSHH